MVLPTVITASGSIVAINNEYWVLQDRVVLMVSCFTNLPEAKINDVLEYKSIDSVIEIGERVFNYRVVEILAKADTKTEEEIVFRDIEIKVFKSSSNFEKKYILISNRSNREFIWTAYRIDPFDRQLKCQQLERPKTIRAKNGQQQINFILLPREQGRKEYTVKADFEIAGEKFQKQAKIIVEVVNTALNVVPAPIPTEQQCRFVDIQMEHYLVPKDLRLINFTNVDLARQELISEYPFLDEELTSENYINRLSYSIYIEEIAQDVAFAAYTLQRVLFEDCENGLRLKVASVAEKRPSIIAGDIITVSDPFCDENSNRFQGRIFQVENDAIKVKFQERFHESHHGKEFNVSFSYSRFMIKKKHHAICKITTNEALGYDFLFPELVSVIESKPPQLDVSLELGKLMMNGTERQWYDQKLNSYQKGAIVNVLRGECRPTPYIIYGPPGTGKTMTVIELIKQIFFLIPNANLIVATPSNSAANLFTEALAKSQKFKSPHDFIRIVSNNQIINEAIPVGLEKYCASVSNKSDDGTLGFEVSETFEQKTRTLIERFPAYSDRDRPASRIDEIKDRQLPDLYLDHSLHRKLYANELP